MCLFNVKDGFLGGCTRPGLRGAAGGAADRPIAGGAWCHRPPAPCAPPRPDQHVRWLLPAPAAEAVVRGHKLGLLTTADYNNLCQCESLEDIKLYLVGAAPAGRRRLAAACAAGCQTLCSGQAAARPSAWACAGRMHHPLLDSRGQEEGLRACCHWAGTAVLCVLT